MRWNASIHVLTVIVELSAGLKPKIERLCVRMCFSCSCITLHEAKQLNTAVVPLLRCCHLHKSPAIFRQVEVGRSDLSLNPANPISERFMLHHRCPITTTTLPLCYRYKPQWKGSHKTNELVLPDSISSSTCVQMSPVCAECSRVDIQFDICELAGAPLALYIPLPMREPSLQ